jgi:hypothetical protein
MPFPFTICRLRRSPRFCQRTFTWYAPAEAAAADAIAAITPL